MELDFDHGGDAHGLKFGWTMEKPGESRLRDDNTYTCCPGKGLVGLEGN